jgi:hypothetical protein
VKTRTTKALEFDRPLSLRTLERIRAGVKKFFPPRERKSALAAVDRETARRGGGGGGPKKLKKRAAKKAAKKVFSWFWISWYWPPSAGPFTLYCPWWISGETDHLEEGTKTVCAAIPAKTPQEAEDVVFAAFDSQPDEINWRLCSPREPGTNPFSGRFPREKWMRWPPKKRTRRLP